jgi:hypothetical protein
MALGNVERHQGAAAGDLDAGESEHESAEAGQAGAWAAAATAAHAQESTEQEGPDDLALAVVREHAAALVAAATERSDSSCSIM